jgi:hypothetical protein
VKSIDELVRNLLKHSRRPEWETRLSDVWHEHIEQATKQIHISPDELASLIGEEGWHDALLGVVFEDFVSRRATDEPSFAEVYLKRAGWREAPAARKYLEAMASSRVSLYDIVDV